MILQRLKKYSLNPRNFLSGVADFIFGWIRDRLWRKLAVGTIPVGVSIWLSLLFWRATTDDYRDQLLTQYHDLAVSALDRGDVEASALFFERSVSLATDSERRSFEVAEVLYDRGQKQRGLAILQGLAPLHTRGHIAAHEFLAKHWRAQSPQTDVTQAIAMYHEMHASGLAEGPRIRLARFLTDHDYPQQAIDCLTALLTPSPEARLQLVQSYSKNGETRSADQQAATAEVVLRQQLSDHVDDRTRILLSRAIACRGRLLDALFVLAEGCESNASPALADELIKFYGIWLSGMSPERARRQLKQIALALELKDSVANTEELTLRNGVCVSLPAAIVVLHRHVLKGEGVWLIPLLQGTELASSAKYAEALVKLHDAHQLRPENSLIANNLAWTTLQSHHDFVRAETPLPEDVKLDLERAWDLANGAVTHHPDEPAFRETRGQLSSCLQRWDEAIEDLNECVAMGHNSAEIQATLKRARKSL